MILRPLAKIHSRFTILKIGDREIPFETRLEWRREDDERPERERCIGADGFEAKHDTAFLEKYGIRAPWNRETGMVDGKQVQFFPAGPPDAMLIPVYDVTLHFCNYYFRDFVQEKRESENPDARHYTKLPLEYLTNLMDLTQREHDMLFRCIDRQIKGEKKEICDPPPPPEPTPEELSNIDELPPPELETLISKLDAQQEWNNLKKTAHEKAAWWASNLKQAHQSQRCGHTKPNGLPCGSPAIKGKDFCHWHSEARSHRTVGPLLEGSGNNQFAALNGNDLTPSGSAGLAQPGAFEMPVLEDHLGVQLGIMRVCDLLAAKSIDPYTARVMLYGLRLAQRTLEKDGLPAN